MLLLSDATEGGFGWTDAQAAHAVPVHVRVRRRFVEEGLEAALHRKTSGRICPRKRTRQARRGWSHWPARPRRRAADAGACDCWPTNASRWKDRLA
ncbi:hypothetical protein [Methylorubrum salsuginis]|uniref:hypothetical protein n=1 Tax=Methylorubrum salsuginis TaxID=414703 RepID=UPI001041BDCD|nr:hypothetical protein [Methylorubrum salsuginis]